jgi:hypothetical protein
VRDHEVKQAARREDVSIAERALDHREVLYGHFDERRGELAGDKPLLEQMIEPVGSQLGECLAPQVHLLGLRQLLHATQVVDELDYVLVDQERNSAQLVA